jgi:hypothetical protein
LGPGEYVLQGQTFTDFRSDDYTSGGFYSADFYTSPIDTLKGTAGFPVDQNVACGGTATFTIGSPGPPGTLSYQWMRGLTPLTNNGHVSGANPTLTIGNACTADVGYYSVVATVIGNPVLTIPPLRAPPPSHDYSRMMRRPPLRRPSRRRRQIRSNRRRHCLHRAAVHSRGGGRL